MSGARINLPHRVEFLRKNVPCWLCSKQLQRVKGKGLLAVFVTVDGIEHPCHKRCAEDEWPLPVVEWAQVAADIGERRAIKRPPDQEREGV